ncbi:hypothetical protein CMI38_03495, partial [Candidatus Pacearchaeota archaeon]|nr:hypothetical protein [Candidatus Pacearchaeota archaeon]
MKRGFQLLSVVVLFGVLSMSFVSAGLFDDIAGWFGGGGDSGLKGELRSGSSGVETEGVWVEAWRGKSGSARNCVQVCEAEGMESEANERGQVCTSGEATISDAVEELGARIFKWGCWPYRCGDERQYYSDAASNRIVGAYCYKPDQKRDYDGTDAIAACHCVGERDPGETSCTDSDGGRNYVVKGTTCVGDDCKDDVCSDSNVSYLNEYFCGSSDSRDDERYECPSGCSDGECVEEIVDDKLISHWRFESNLEDSVGGNDGVSSDVSFSEGKIGEAGTFFSGFLNKPVVMTVPDSASLGGIDSVSIGGWVYVNSFGDYNTIVNKRYSYLFTLDSSGRIMVWGGTGSAWGARVLTSTGRVASNGWHHVLVTSNSAGSKAYIDGELVGSGVSMGRIADNNDPLEIGYRNVEGYQPYNGKIDELKIWSKVLSASEVKEEFEREEDKGPLKMMVSIATLKDSYGVGEKIKLTDPPEEIVEISIPESNSVEGIDESINFLEGDFEYRAVRGGLDGIYREYVDSDGVRRRDIKGNSVDSEGIIR